MNRYDRRRSLNWPFHTFSLAFSAVAFLSVPSAWADMVDVTAVIRVHREGFTGTSSAKSSQDEYETYRQTQAALIRSPLVIASALRDDKVAQLKPIAERESPAQWLLTSLKVEAINHSELIRISLTGDESDKSNLEAIVNGVVKTYLAEVVSKEQLQRRDTLDGLRDRYRSQMSLLAKKSDEIQSVAKQVGSATAEDLELELRLLGIDYRVEVQRLSDLKTMKLKIQLEELAARKDADSEVAKKSEEIYAARQQLLAGEIDRVASNVARSRDRIRELSGISAQLTEGIQDVAALRKVARTLRDEIQQLEVELTSPNKIVVIQEAYSRRRKSLPNR